MRRLGAGLLVTLAIVTGCARSVGGTAHTGSREADPASFFAGAVPTYGVPVGSDGIDALAYLRAIRRIDPCGLLTRDDLAKIGEIGSVGTLFAFNECDVDVKVPGEAAHRYVSVELTLTQLDGQPVEFRANGPPVYEAYPGSCDYLVPLDLSPLPGAPPPRTSDRPFVRIGLIADGNCAFVQRLVRALAPRVATLHVPLRDGLALYPAHVAEHDPCHVLAAVGSLVGHWDVERSRPFDCDFTMRRTGGDDTPVQVSLKPQAYDNSASATRMRVDRGGVEVFVDQETCTATTFVGPPLRRKLFGGHFLPTGAVILRPAVVVDAGLGQCAAATDVAAAAAKFYV